MAISLSEQLESDIKAYLHKTFGRTRPGSTTISYRGVAQLVARLLWEQEARGSSPRTPTIFGRKTAFSGGFSALFVLLLQFCRLLFSDGSRGGNAVDTRTGTAAETAKSLTHP